MPKLTQLRRETGEVEIPTAGDDPLRITYRKAFVSPALSKRLSNADDLPSTDQLAILADLVKAAVVSWNLTDEDDEPMPVSAASIDALDAGSLQVIATAIQESMRPDPTNGTDSSPISSATERSEPVPIGTRS